MDQPTEKAELGAVPVRKAVSQDVYQFVKNKAISVGSCEGYFIPLLLTTTAFILASNNAQVNITTHKQPLNIFTIFVGYLGTGKFN